MGQSLPNDVQPVIIKYLQEHYTPETPKPVSLNTLAALW
jgi:hypothetical protein